MNASLRPQMPADLKAKVQTCVHQRRVAPAPISGQLRISDYPRHDTIRAGIGML
jgi:hypothetical protein